MGRIKIVDGVQYEYQGGSSRRWINTETGESLSRRQFEYLDRGSYGNEGPRSRTAAIIKERPGYARTVAQRDAAKRDFIEQQAAKGIDPKDVRFKRSKTGSQESAAEWREIKDAFQNYEKQLKKARKDGNLAATKAELHAPDGELARALEKLGRRNPEWTHPVGESPKKSK